MIFQQFYLNCLAHASYVIGDEQTGVAAVVDPQRDVDRYLAFAEEHRLRIQHVFLTHLHADFVAGHLELRDRLGATIYLGASARTEYSFSPLRDGTVVEFGRVRLQTLETPGHTAESVSILVYDLGRPNANEPYAVLTGDTLFIGDVGRPDLRVALGWSAADLGGMLFDSLRTKLLLLPDASLVYPAHGAGSLCGRAISKETVSTIGEQRRLNYALQPMSKETFVKLVTADQPDAPAYFTYNAVLNSQEHGTLGETLSQMKPLNLNRTLELQASGAQILDTREPEEFASVHLASSINIALSGQYATWAGTVLTTTLPIVIIANPGRENESALRLGRIGFDHVAGYLENGVRNLEAHPERAVFTERLSASYAAELLSSSEPPLVVDVRAPREREEKLIDGSVHIPLNHLVERATELPKDRALLVYCAGGYRSSIAASLLQRCGFSQVGEIAGGITAWEAAKLPVTTRASTA
ncbi:MAG TPA: MBL fold metallo-hydrolase [Candidatus Acidoferrales bacterium]|nr:MBL fold metallo-hydrolase [Candidatus Acidoferrales bacterium]